MNANLIWSIVLAVIGIAGLYLAGSHNRFGWLLGAFTQILWIIFAAVTKQYGFFLSAVVYGWVYLRNYYRWGREHYDENETATPDTH